MSIWIIFRFVRVQQQRPDRASRPLHPAAARSPAPSSQSGPEALPRFQNGFIDRTILFIRPVQFNGVQGVGNRQLTADHRQIHGD